jgi:hypothetical protein
MSRGWVGLWVVVLAYRVKVGDEEVDFDGFKDGVLLEAKGTGYAKFLDDNLKAKKFYKGLDKLLEQAQGQFRVAGGRPIRWIVAEDKLAVALRALFRGRGIKIQVVHVPPNP